MLGELGADDDLISEIIKYERRSPEPIDCTGLEEKLLEEDYTMRAPVIVPLMVDVEAARIHAQNAYTKWMSYMSGVIWGWVILPLVRQPVAYACITDSKNVDEFKRSLTWLLIHFAG